MVYRLRLNTYSYYVSPMKNRVTLREPNISQNSASFLTKNILTKSSRSVQRSDVILSSSKGFKVRVRQTLRMIWLSRTWTPAAFVWLESEWAAGFFWDLQLWQLVRGNQSVDSFSIQKTRGISNIGFARSKWPRFNSAYVLGVFITFSATVRNLHLIHRLL